MAALPVFRSYQIAEDARGASLELWRSDAEVVCLASDPQHCQFVQLHIISGIDASDPAAKSTLEAFKAQSAALMRVSHPNLAELREFGEDEGALFYVTEYADGESLDTYLARCNPIPAWLALEIASQLVAGLSALRSLPLVLARMDVFAARFLLDGETTAGLKVRLGSYPIPSGKTESISEAQAEKVAVNAVGRLLLYAVTGLVVTDSPHRAIAALASPDLQQLATGMVDPSATRPLTTLDAVESAIARLMKLASFATRPDRLPATLRPRLPLQAHFSSLKALGEILPAGKRLERTAFDAVQPYAQRAFGTGGAAEWVQLLPSPKLLDRALLQPWLEASMDRVSERDHPRLLRVMELPAGADWFIEEASSGKHTVETALRLRKKFSPSEVMAVLQQVELAATEAESVGLTASVLAPSQLFIEFTADDGRTRQPSDDELARLPLDGWPLWRLRVRTHPITLNVTQPSRFHRETLLGKQSRALFGRSSSASEKVDAADLASLATWLLGGENSLPGRAAGVIQQALANGSGAERRAFLLSLEEVLVPRVAAAPKAPAPAPVAKKSEVSLAPAKKKTFTPEFSPSPAVEEARRKEKGDAEARKQTAEAKVQPLAAPLIGKAVSQASPPAEPEEVSISTEPPRRATRPVAKDEEAADTPLDFSALSGATTRSTAPSAHGEGGFAEILFGQRSALEAESAPVPSSAGPLAPPSAAEEETPLGALFFPSAAHDMSTSGSDDALVRMDFGPRAPVGLPWRLIAFIILTGLALALIFAKLTHSWPFPSQ